MLEYSALWLRRPQQPQQMKPDHPREAATRHWRLRGFNGMGAKSQLIGSQRLHLKQKKLTSFFAIKCRPIELVTMCRFTAYIGK